MLLAIDIGNTRTACGLFEREKLITYFFVPTGKKIFLERNDISAVVLGSVVPKATGIVRKSFKAVPILEVNSGLDLGLKIKYKNPHEVGADRLANAVAVKNLYSVPAFVIDFGTAVTIDVVSAQGDYLGGVILPGIEMVRRALYENTALLPHVQFKKPHRILGQTTINAIQSGLFYGFRGMVRQLVRDLMKELRFPKKTVIIATGGNAVSFAKSINAILSPTLTLEGLRLVYERESRN